MVAVCAKRYPLGLRVAALLTASEAQEGTQNYSIK